MSNKTCCDCAFLIDGYCGYHQKEFGIIEPVCEEFELMPEQKPTNGDVIRQGGNAAIAEFSWSDPCLHCAYSSGKCKRPMDKTCKDGQLAWLNAPAESEGEDE